MIQKSPVFSFIIILIFFEYLNIFAESLQQGKAIVYKATFAYREPVLDGKLDDEIWQRPPDVDNSFITYSPTYGDIFPEKTNIWLAYDENNLYFAFYCFDTKPESIKTSLTKRDNMWSDDWIGFNIDTIGNKRYGYVLVVNPNGIQGDLYDSSATGSDEAPDYVWYSNGRIVDDGFIIEMKLPLSSIKYKSGKNVKMNIIFERKVTRLGLMASWPEVPAGKGFFAGMATVLYPELKSQPRFEGIPSLTYSSFWDRESPDNWRKTASHLNLGLTAKYAFTSSISGEATMNPDFSQIETDAFQIEVNQRYPVFYSEKRPFFMEVSEIFSIAGSTFSCRNMQTAIHTRNIIEPGWGLKLTGELKKLSFGILVSDDEWPGREFYPEVDESDTNPLEGEKALFVIGRAKYGLSQDSYIGAIFSSRKFGDGSNQVWGGDLYLRLGKGNHFLRSNYLFSTAKEQDESERMSGSSFTASYEYHSKKIDSVNVYEYFGKDFKMETAFIIRDGISKFSSYLGYNIFPSSKKNGWIKRITPFLYAYYLHDLYTLDNDFVLKGGISFNFTKNGTFKIEFDNFKEYWLNQPYKGCFLVLSGGAQIFNWLNLNSSFMFGDGIYYDQVDPQMGKEISFDFQTNIQPNEYLSQFFQFYYQRLDRDIDGEKLYEVNILNSRTTFQVNKHLFLRAIVQFDSYFKTLLSDALISYELIPGTVIHLGYGSLHEQLYWSEIDSQWLKHGHQMKYYQSKQSLFFKISYLFRF